MAEDKKSAAANEAEKSKKKALEKAEKRVEQNKSSQDMDKLFKGFEKTFEKSFASLLKGMSGIEKTIGKSNDKLERIADNSTKIAFNTAATMERLYTLIKHERETDRDNVILIDGKQYAKLEKIADNTDDISRRTLMVAERLWTLIKHERTDDKDKSITIDDKQFARIEMMNKNISSINRRADNIQQRIWVLQDLMNKVLEYPKFDTLLDTMVQRHLIQIKDTLKSGGSTTSTQRGYFSPITTELMVLSNIMKDILDITGRMFTVAKNTHKMIASMAGKIIKATRTVSAVPTQKQQNQNNPKKQPPDVDWWDKTVKEYRKDWRDFTDHLSGIFQRGIIGRLAGLNPLVSLGTDLLRDVAQTLTDVGGTLWKTFILMSSAFGSKGRAKFGAGFAKAQENLKEKAAESLFSVISNIAMAMGAASGFFGKFAGFFTGLTRGSKLIKLAGWINGLLGFFEGAFIDFNKLENQADSMLGKIFQRLTLGLTRGIFNFLGMFIDLFVDLPTYILGKLTGIDWLAETDFSQLFSDTAQKGIMAILDFMNSDILGDLMLNMKHLGTGIGKFFINLPMKLIGGVLDAIGMEKTGALVSDFDFAGYMSEKITGIVDGLIGSMTNAFEFVGNLFTKTEEYIDSWWSESELNPENWEWLKTIENFFASIAEMIDKAIEKVTSIVPDWMKPETVVQTTRHAVDKVDEAVYNKMKPAPALSPEQVKENQRRLDAERDKKQNGNNTTVINNVSAGGGQQGVGAVVPAFNTESSFFGMG